MKPNIVEYLNIFQYLQDHYNYRKKVDDKFSYSTWAKELGLNNKSQLRFVVIGKRPLGDKLLEKLKTSLGLNETEQKILELLSAYTQSASDAQKKMTGTALLSLIRIQSTQHEINLPLDSLNTPFIWAVRTLLTFKDIKLNIEEISKVFLVEESEALQAVATLKAHGLVLEKDGRLSSTSTSVVVPNKFRSGGLDNFYQQSFKNASEAINFQVDSRKFRSWFLALSAAEFQAFTSKAEDKLRQEVLSFDQDILNDRRIYQVLMATVPITAFPGSEDEH